MRLSQAQRELFHQHGYFINGNGGAYLSGTSLGYTKKVEVASVYERPREDCGEHQIFLPLQGSAQPAHGLFGK